MADIKTLKLQLEILKNKKDNIEKQIQILEEKISTKESRISSMKESNQF